MGATLHLASGAVDGEPARGGREGGCREPSHLEMTPHPIQIDVLGPLRISVSDSPSVAGGPALRHVDVPDAHTRAAVSLLTLRAPHPVSLADVVYAVAGSPTASTLRRVRSALRALAEQLPFGILTVRDAARLMLPGGASDARRHTDLLGAARAAWHVGDRQTCMTKTCAALALWRGDPYPDLAECLDALPEVQRLREAHLDAIELYQEFLLRTDVDFETVESLRMLVADYPARRTFRLQFARALHSSGRQVESLQVLRDAVTELGDSPLTRHITGLIARRDPAAATTATIEPAGGPVM